MKYKKKPITIEAIQWTGKNIVEVASFFKDNGSEAVYSVEKEAFEINTLEGTIEAYVGDYIIKDSDGEFYPCKEDIFDETYDAIDDQIVKSRKKVIKG